MKSKNKSSLIYGWVVNIQILMTNARLQSLASLLVCPLPICHSEQGE